MIINRFALSEKAQLLPWAHKLSKVWSCKFEPPKSPDRSRTFVFTHIIRRESARKLIRSSNVNMANTGALHGLALGVPGGGRSFPEARWVALWPRERA